MATHQKAALFSQDPLCLCVSAREWACTCACVHTGARHARGSAEAFTPSSDILRLREVSPARGTQKTPEGVRGGGAGIGGGAGGGGDERERERERKLYHQVR